MYPYMYSICTISNAYNDFVPKGFLAGEHQFWFANLVLLEKDSFANSNGSSRFTSFVRHQLQWFNSSGSIN